MITDLEYSQLEREYDGGRALDEEAPEADAGQL